MGALRLQESRLDAGQLASCALLAGENECRGQDSNLHGGRPPRDFKSLASTDFATPALAQLFGGATRSTSRCLAKSRSAKASRSSTLANLLWGSSRSLSCRCSASIPATRL